MARITAIILTYNEEVNIKRCIDSLSPLVERIVVVDSYSSDKTVEIAKSLGVEVYSHSFVNQAKQFIWALDNIDIYSPWIIRFDADEEMTEKARLELEDLLIKNENTNVNGIVLRYEVEFIGKKLRHGGIYPFKKMFVFKKGKAHMEDRAMDEHIILDEGISIEMKNDCLHHDFKGLSSWIDKHNTYSTREANSFFEKTDNENAKKLNKSAKKKRFFKDKLYYKLPMGLRAHLYFVYRYYFKLGFLDGKEGKIFAFMQAYWYRYLVDAKIYEQRKAKK